MKCQRLISNGGRARPCVNDAKFIVTGFAGTRLKYCGVHAMGMKRQNPERVVPLADIAGKRLCQNKEIT